MIPLILSATFGLAVWLLYDGLTRPVQASFAVRRWRAFEEFLRRAGLVEATPRDFALFSLGAGLLAGAFAQLFLGCDGGDRHYARLGNGLNELPGPHCLAFFNCCVHRYRVGFVVQHDPHGISRAAKASRQKHPHGRLDR